MTEGLRLAGKEGFDGNKAVGACFTGCPVLENCTRSVNDGAGRFHTDGNGGEQHDGRCADQQAERGEQVESPLEAAQGTSGIERKAFFREQPFGADL